jgi:sensor domain CHASE-containing protein
MVSTNQCNGSASSDILTGELQISRSPLDINFWSAYAYLGHIKGSTLSLTDNDSRTCFYHSIKVAIVDVLAMDEVFLSLISDR